MSVSRRRLLGAAFAAGAFRNDTLRALAALRPHDGGPDDEGFWSEVRAHFDVPTDSLSFNHAGLAPSPRAVRDALAREQRRTDRDPSRVLWREQEKELDAVRARLAGLVGCRADQLALVPNATYGLQTVVLGLRMDGGDAIVASAHEYSRTFHALRQRGERDGVDTVTVALAVPAADPAEVAADVLRSCGPRTRLVVLSQITYLTGQTLPVAAVAGVLAKRGVPVLVDAAHGIGLMPETFAELGGAFYAACLHKWLMGPIGTGVLVAEPAWLDRVLPLCPGEAALATSVAKFEQYGTHAAAPLLAVHEALDFHEWLTRERKAARLEFLRRRLAAALAQAPGVRLCGGDPARSRVITAVAFERVPAKVLAAWLWREHRIHVTTAVAGELDALRISANVFTTPAEIDRLADVLARVARDGI